MVRIGLAFALSAMMATLHTPAQAMAAESAQDGVSIEWLGHMFFRLTAPNGAVLMTSPWLRNADIPIRLENIDRADVLLVPNSHPDDIGNPVEISSTTGARVVLPRGLAEWQLESGLDPAAMLPTEIGDSLDLHGVRIHVVWNRHDNTIRPAGIDGGPAQGYVMQFENGLTVYFAASSALHEQMADYALTFQPHIALINANEDFIGIAQTLMSENPNLHTVVPIHLRAGDPRFFDYAAQAESLGLGLTVFHPALGVPYWY